MQKQPRDKVQKFVQHFQDSPRASISCAPPSLGEGGLGGDPVACPSTISGAQCCSQTLQRLILALAGWMGPGKIACWALRLWEGGFQIRLRT